MVSFLSGFFTEGRTERSGSVKRLFLVVIFWLGIRMDPLGSQLVVKISASYESDIHFNLKQMS